MPFLLRARSDRATVQLKDREGNSYLAYEYEVGRDVDGQMIDNAIIKDKDGNAIGTLNNVSTVLDSAKNTASSGGVGNQYTLTGELLIKKSVTDFYLDITVTGRPGPQRLPAPHYQPADRLQRPHHPHQQQHRHDQGR